MQESTPADWITYEQAQRLTSLGRTTLWRICSAEDSGIEVARVGRAVRINRASLTLYMKRSTERWSPDAGVDSQVSRSGGEK